MPVSVRSHDNDAVAARGSVRTYRQPPVTSNATLSKDTRFSAKDLVPSGVLTPDQPTSPHRLHRSRPRKSHHAHPGRPRDRPIWGHQPSPPQLVLSVRENQRDNDIDRYELKGKSTQVDRGGRFDRWASSPSAFSQQSPCPGSVEPKPGPGQSLRTAVSCLQKQRSEPCGAETLRQSGSLCAATFRPRPTPAGVGRGQFLAGRGGLVDRAFGVVLDGIRGRCMARPAGLDARAPWAAGISPQEHRNGWRHRRGAGSCRGLL